MTPAFAAASRAFRGGSAAICQSPSTSEDRTWTSAWLILKHPGGPSSAAQVHISEVQQRVERFREYDPGPLSPSQSVPMGGLVASRCADRSGPIRSRADAVATCAALDYISYELARHHVGQRANTGDAASAFPPAETRQRLIDSTTAGQQGIVPRAVRRRGHTCSRASCS